MEMQFGFTGEIFARGTLLSQKHPPCAPPEKHLGGIPLKGSYSFAGGFPVAPCTPSGTPFGWR